MTSRQLYKHRVTHCSIFISNLLFTFFFVFNVCFSVSLFHVFLVSYYMRNVWSLSWILKAEGWGDIEISSNGMVDRREEGGGRGRGNYPPLPAHFYRNQIWRLGKLSLVCNANLRSQIRRLYCRLVMIWLLLSLPRLMHTGICAMTSRNVQFTDRTSQMCTRHVTSSCQQQEKYNTKYCCVYVCVCRSRPDVGPTCFGGRTYVQ